jgi:16S rRNA A1518/A1519 N6-dimethyltransferase RsmA/KsgA/DIM1 with predicted DNA glycosylase/AP lyase activity
VDRAVFTPRPRIDSALIGLTRRATAPAPALVGLVRAAFAHRRKPLAGSLELAGGPSRVQAHAALGAIGIDRDARAERLAPEDFARLLERLEPG